MPHETLELVFAKTGGGGALGALGSHASITSAGCLVRGRLCAQSRYPYGLIQHEGKPVDADVTYANARVGRWHSLPGLYQYLYLQGEALPGRFYGDRGTLVLGSDNQKDYVHGFASRDPRVNPS